MKHRWLEVSLAVLCIRSLEVGHVLKMNIWLRKLTVRRPRMRRASGVGSVSLHGSWPRLRIVKSPSWFWTIISFPLDSITLCLRSQTKSTMIFAGPFRDPAFDALSFLCWSIISSTAIPRTGTSIATGESPIFSP
ncbi:hypothetical protein FOVG_12227 [Fusarium oxysporum f. sp. pisi HDV247]|uniref:Uncharacterized protein n=1 Tax=Fusarium oxysporum f. sp. pisi HDV247 TaxID=1080344 RepID=W9P8U0_FUSOX|nr:hypothetical protein FOVG_12227 [Fusarium oxysporum f. sp. pisi HDV247]